MKFNPVPVVLILIIKQMMWLFDAHHKLEIAENIDKLV